MPTEKRIFATPLSRKIAAERQIDLSRVAGSGPRGRITSKDLLKFTAQHHHSGGTNFQQSTSRKMTIAGSIPQFSLTIECRVDDLVDLRMKRNEMAGVFVNYTQQTSRRRFLISNLMKKLFGSQNRQILLSK